MPVLKVRPDYVALFVQRGFLRRGNVNTNEIFGYILILRGIHE